MRIAALSLLLALSAPAAAQQAQAWREVKPPNEEFVALMPPPLFTLYREVPFAENLTLTPLIYEAANDGVHFLVLSFRKSERAGEPAVLRTFDSFSGGFEHSVLRNPHARDNSVERGEDVTLQDGKMRPYHVRMEARLGVARLYEAPKHFYVVMALGGADGDGRIDRFLESFKLKTGDSAQGGEGGAGGYGGVVRGGPPPGPPPGPWPLRGPVAGAPVSVGILNRRMLNRPMPEYPSEAREARVSGAVAVRITFDETGKVISATAVSGHPLLREAAVKAAYKARFAPVKLSGVPVKVSGLITYNFNLN